MATKVDYKKMSIEALEAMIFEISREIELRKKIEAENVRKQIENLLAQSGLTIHEIFTEKSPKKGGKAPLKYQNPSNPSEAWSGRGKMPVWMRKLVDKGASKEDFRIQE